MQRRFGVLALVVLPVLFGFSNESKALQCGALTCEMAGTVNGSPFVVGDFGDFTRSVDAVSPKNSGDSYAHAWGFSLLEPAHITGTLTKNNTLANYAQNPLSLALFSGSDLTTNIGATFFVPNTGDDNPFVSFRFANLAPGDYFFRVAGTLIGNDGQYAGQLAVNQVPLPPAVWLFLTAILGIVTIARKKRALTAA